MHWQVAESDDGIPYYFNEDTGSTQWDPPPEIFEGYISEDGKPYFHNTLTNETVWEVRDEVRDYLASKNNKDVAAEIPPSLDEKRAKLNNDVFQNGDRLRLLVRDYVKNKFNVEAERYASPDLAHNENWKHVKIIAKKTMYVPAFISHWGGFQIALFYQDRKSASI